MKPAFPAIKSFSKICAFSLIAAFGLCNARAGSYTQAFTFADGTTALGDNSTLVSGGDNATPQTASVQGGALQLTLSGRGGTLTAFKLPDLDPGREIAEFTMSFDLRMAASGTPADGWSLNFGAIPADSGTGEEGFNIPNGLVIAFDTYDNDGAGTADIIGIDAISNGQSAQVVPQTFPFDNLSYQVSIHWDSQGLDLIYRGATIFDNLQVPGFVPENGYRFAFNARTGGATEGVYIDNLNVATAELPPIVTSSVVISEFVASNKDSYEDEDTDSPDWIELYNGTPNAQNLDGLYLTTSSTAATKWRLPAVTMAPNTYLVVFASGKNRSLTTRPLHTDFTLPKENGYIGLLAANGTTVLNSVTYGAQQEDVSYGLFGQTQTPGYFDEATPGRRNKGIQAPNARPEEVVFSRQGGLILPSQTVTLNVAPLVAGDAVIRYLTSNNFSTASTLPTATSTLWPVAGLSITSTQTVRARAFRPDHLPGKVSSRAFTAIDASLANYKNSGSAFSSNLPIIVADSYSFNVDSVASGTRPFRISHAAAFDTGTNGRASLADIPQYEGRSGFHVRGESSSGFPQKGYAWETWNSNDEDKDEAILGMPADSDWVLYNPYTDKTLMRNYIVYNLMRELYGNGGGMRTRFVELFFNQDGGAVNYADYRGVYVLVEKIKRGSDRVDIAKLNDLMTDPAMLDGGYIFKKDKPSSGLDFNTSNGIPLQFVEPENPTNLQKTAFFNYMNAFEAALNGTNFGSQVNGYSKYIDTQTFIDNHLMVETTKQIDGYRISTYFTKDRGSKIRALPIWDYNLSLGNANYLAGDQFAGWYYTQVGGTDYLWYARLFQDPEFVLKYWDRYWALRQSKLTTPAINAKIDSYSAIVRDGNNTVVPNNSTLDTPVARHFAKHPILGTYVWPNAGGDPAGAATLTPRPWEVNTTFQSEVDWMKTWFENRLLWIDGQYTKAPVYNNYGGQVAFNFALTITDPNAAGGQIIYTTDGSDPRTPPGETVFYSFVTSNVPGTRALVPSVANGGDLLTSTAGASQWNALAAPPSYSQWMTATTSSAGYTGVGFENNPGDANNYTSMIGIDTKTQMLGVNRTVYIRVPFSVDSQEIIDGLTKLNLLMSYDDGFIAYINGTEVARRGATIDNTNIHHPPLWNDGSPANHDDGLVHNAASNIPIYETVDITAFKNALLPGSNVLAIHGLNFGASSSDFVILPVLNGEKGVNVGQAPGAQTYGGPLSLTQSATVKARIKNGTTWGPITSANFIVNTVPAAPANLLISEIHYAPTASTLAESQAGFAAKDFEYLELQNISASNIDLTNVTINDGITFTFLPSFTPAQLTMAPGARLVIPANITAFEMRFGTAIAHTLLAFAGSLSNSGERLTIRNTTGNTFDPWWNFVYGIAAPWPTEPLALGYSLVLMNPVSRPDPTLPQSWRPSIAKNGSPGTTDQQVFAGIPDADDDNDGYSNLMEFVMGTQPGNPNSNGIHTCTVQPQTFNSVSGNYLNVSFKRNLAADTPPIVPQLSTDLAAWESGPAIFTQMSSVHNEDGTATVTYRSTQPVTGNRIFVRLNTIFP